jgi:hypothetical protein
MQVGVGSTQIIGMPKQTPAVQESPVVHAMASLQPVPSVTGGFEQAPVPGSQIPGLWHWSGLGQTTCVPAVQVPDWHVSTPLHNVESLQVVPLPFCGFEQTPVPGSQTPGLWHWSGVGQTTCVPAVQVPDWHVSIPLHNVESLQAVPFITGVCATPPIAVHESAVHGFMSSIGICPVPIHVPVWQVSLGVHVLLSLHIVPFVFGGFEQAPFAGLQTPAL